jgi:hypothetical protein
MLLDYAMCKTKGGMHGLLFFCLMRLQPCPRMAFRRVGRVGRPATSTSPTSIAVGARRTAGVFDTLSIAPAISNLVEREDLAAAVQAAGASAAWTN